MSRTLETGGEKPQRLITAWAQAAEQVFEQLTQAKPDLQWSARPPGDTQGEDAVLVEWWEARYEGGKDQKVWIGVATSADAELGRLAHALATAGEKEAPSHSVESTVNSLCEAFAKLLTRQTGRELVLQDVKALDQPPEPALVFSTQVNLAEGTMVPILVGFNDEMKTRFDHQPAESPAHAAALGTLLNLELPLRVRFGRVQMSLERVLETQVGSVFELEGSHDDPVDLLVNGSLVAKGEVVAVDGYYGVRILEVTGREQRAAALGQ